MMLFSQRERCKIREVVDAMGHVVQATHYYPFGTSICDRHSAINPNLQPFKNNRKGLDLMHCLNTYDYDACRYAPILGSRDRMDPMCEKYYNVSPYAYCGNNPVMLVDPDGREVIAADILSRRNIIKGSSKN